mgnify:CR=1 FL=1
MSYVKDCIYCGQKIRMDNNNTSSKWTPYEVDKNEIHECKNKQQQQQQQKQKQQPTTALTLEDIDKRFKKVEYT